MKKETADQLEAFRQQREAAEQALLDEADNQQRSNTGAALPADQETWVSSGKKRRRYKEKDTLVGTKLRKMSSSAEKDGLAKPASETGIEKQADLPETRKESEKYSVHTSERLSQEQPPTVTRTLPATATTPTTMPATSSTLGLGGYSSDED